MSTRALTWDDASDAFDPDEPQDVVQFIRDGSFTDELADDDAIAECPKCGLAFLDTDEANAHVGAFGHRVEWR
jgi:hypothetical protein